MLTIRHIILWERLTHRPFSRFDGSDKDDVFTLMYCWDEARQRDTLLSVYLQAARFPTMEQKAFLRDVNRELTFVGQFSHDSPPTPQGSDKKKDDCHFTEIFQMLVFKGGLDAGWLLGQSLELLPVLVKGMEDQYHTEQSDKKFWTLLQMSPHMTNAGQRKLRNSLTFDWEKEKSGRLTTEQEMALGPALFKGIMKKKKTHPNPPVEGGSKDTNVKEESK